MPLGKSKLRDEKEERVDRGREENVFLFGQTYLCKLERGRFYCNKLVIEGHISHWVWCISDSYANFLKLFLRRESSQASRGEAERERDRIPSRLCAVSAEPNMELELTNHEIMT